jgi:hypothetical protein
MMSDQKLKLAFNPELIDKNEAGNMSLFASGWVNREVTGEEFEAAILRGWAYTAQLTGARRTSNFAASNIASVDVDRGLTLEQAVQNPFVRQCGHLIYTTGRHTAEAHRFRVVFRLAETIVAASKMRALNRGLARRLSGDMAATDPTRISYGNRSAQVIRIGGEIGPELMRELVADAALPDNTDLPGREIVSRRSYVTLAPDHELRLADGRTVRLCDFPEKTPVHCPIHLDRNASAFIVRNRHSVAGVYCSACSKTYWPETQRGEEYDPDDFVRTARKIAAASATEIKPLDELNGSILAFVGERLAGRKVSIVQRQVAPFELEPGITLIRSDKGSGKTEAVKRFALRMKSVLLISHRRTLIRGSCRRLGLHCYLDLNRKPKPGASEREVTIDAFKGEDHDED